jgi:hypothetical protein
MSCELVKMHAWVVNLFPGEKRDLVICDDMFMLSCCIINLSLLLWSIYIACRFKVPAKSWLAGNRPSQWGWWADRAIGNVHHV